MVEKRPYYRRDQADGISAPDLRKNCSYADHIVHARGKRTRFTSVTLDLNRCRNFGECDYELLRDAVELDKHRVVEHEELLSDLQRTADEGEQDERLKAIQALRYARTRREGLVDWRFDVSKVESKEVITWAYRRVQGYFARR